MSIERKKISKSVKVLVKGADKLDFSISIQRNEVWDLDRKSLFIHSLIYGYPVPPIYFSEGTDGKMQILDGKQRLTTIIKFVNGGFTLSENTPPIEFNGHYFDINGKDYEALASCTIKEQGKKEKDYLTLKDLLDDYSVEMTELKGITSDERDEFFLRTNNGMSLTSFELARCLAKEGVMNFVKEITGMPFYQRSSFSDKAKNRFVDQESVLQTISLLMGKTISFSGKDLKGFVIDLHDAHKGVPQETANVLKDIMAYLSEAYPENTKYLKKVHIPMLAMTALEAKEKGIAPAQFKIWTDDFFSVMHSNTPYGRACGAGSAKRDNIKKRLDNMSQHFNKFVELQSAQAESAPAKGSDKEWEESAKSPSPDASPDSNADTTGTIGEGKDTQENENQPA